MIYDFRLAAADFEIEILNVFFFQMPLLSSVLGEAGRRLRVPPLHPVQQEKCARNAFRLGQLCLLFE